MQKIEYDRCYKSYKTYMTYRTHRTNRIYKTYCLAPEILNFHSISFQARSAISLAIRPLCMASSELALPMMPRL